MIGALTVINYHRWGSKLCLHLREDLSYGKRICEVAPHVHLRRGAFFFFQASGCECDPIAFGSKCSANILSDVGASSENEGNR